MLVVAMIKTVSVQELCEQLETDPESVLIDVRRPQEFEQGHVPRACNIPLGSMPLTQMLAEWSREAEGKPIYFICQSGGRSQHLLDELAQAGFHDAQSVAGGMVAWQAMGLPVELKPSPAVEFTRERLTMLVAGLLVMLSGALGFLVHSGFFAISVLAGAELVFTGLTGWPGAASLFGRKNRDR
jgi:rhodanese-related sulfurtransferase